MARYESEGYCPNIWVPKKWNEETDMRLAGLWSIFGANVVYAKKDENKCSPDTEKCDEMFANDPIAFDLMTAIVRFNAVAEKILIHQLHNGASNTQKISDIQLIMGKAEKPQLVVKAGSNFAVVLAEASYGIDLWVWDLRTCW